MKKLILLMCMCCLIIGQNTLVQAKSVPQAKITSFDCSEIKNEAGEISGTRLEFGFNRPLTEFKVEADHNNDRQLKIVLNNAKRGSMDEEIVLSSHVRQLDKMRLQKKNRDLSGMIVFSETINKMEIKSFTVEADRKKHMPFKLIIEVVRPTVKKDFSSVAGRTIVIDPGHGGSDSGAVGPHGVKESDVNFAVSRYLEQLLKDNGANVIMTRTEDVDVYGPNASDRAELQARVNKGIGTGADLFLSVHSNSFSSPSAHGTATYYYLKTAQDRLLARVLQNGMVEQGGLYDRGIHEANFYVLGNSRMPAALVELAFISNYNEERLLESADFQQKLAKGLCSGLNEYFKQR